MHKLAKSSTLVLALLSPSYFQCPRRCEEIKAAKAADVKVVPVYSSEEYTLKKAKQWRDASEHQTALAIEEPIDISEAKDLKEKIIKEFLT